MANAPDSLNFADLMPKVAARLFDKPNKSMSSARELRFGTHGSMSIDLESGQFYDHEAKVGGGVLDLIQRERNVDLAGALSWLEAEDLKGRQEQPQEVWQLGKRATGSIFYDYADEHGEVL